MSENVQSKIKIYVNCVTNMHHLIISITNDDIEKPEILESLSNMSNTMEQLANDPCFLAEDDILGVGLDDMPKEIKDWLASTFNNVAAPVARKNERPRFKAVVNAILAMLMVEKIFRKSNENAAMNIPPAVAKMMENDINEWDFDVVALSKISENNTLKYLTMYLFLHHNILRKYKISSDLLEAFLDTLESGYCQNKNPYNNSLHACDVVQTVHYFIQNFKLTNWLSNLQIFVFLFCAVIHDHDDPGFSNAFLVKTGHPLALIYNDVQVRENHHIYSVFRILQNPKCNFIRGLNKNEYSEFRKMTIECLLNADLSQHFYHIKCVKGEIASGNEFDKIKILEFLFHAADISHPTKVWSLHKIWVSRWQEQMYRQGDLELEMNIPYSPLCSRKINYAADIHSNLLIHIIEPTFQLVAQVLDLLKNQISFIKTITNTPEQLLAVPSLTKHNSANSISKLYPWVNRIILNKSMWQRLNLTKHPVNE